MLIIVLFLIIIISSAFSLTVMVMEYIDHRDANLKGERPYGRATFADFERELNKISDWGHQSRNYLVLRDNYSNITDRVYLKDMCIIFGGKSMLLSFTDYHKAQKLIRKKCKELNKKVETVNWSEKNII